MSLTGDFLIKLSSKPNPPYEFVSIWNFIPSQLYSLLMVVGGVVFLLLIKRFYRPPAAREEVKKKPPSSRRMRKRIDRSK